MELKSSLKRLASKSTISSPTQTASSSTTLISIPMTPTNSQTEENSRSKTTSTSSMTAPYSEEHLNQLAAGIDVNLSAIRQLLETQLPHKDNGRDRLASMLQQRVGINSQAGVHLQGGETKLPRKPRKEATGRCSNGRQLKLNQLFEEASKSSNPMWDSLMQLAANMCENRDASAERPPKQYSIYLMVNSDDEDEENGKVPPAQTTPTASSSNSRFYSRFDKAPQDHLTMPWKPAPSLPKMRKRAAMRSRRDQEPYLNASRPPRRPLHWPKQDFSKLATMTTGKKLKKSKKLKYGAQSGRKYQYRWS
ncbi:hypothetical protein KR093_009584 [Drosophila rubida]|uniref:Uncharacterized protein n=1 Tax=Drosophila rubida TaxID=30044 RepID=A0AAD4K2E3_9MUSC|nr:hypothetical protein KR093_009584 [Drosophila rubida]